VKIRISSSERKLPQQVEQRLRAVPEAGGASVFIKLDILAGVRHHVERRGRATDWVDEFERRVLRGEM
jgi:hypothetical protein